MARPNDRRSTRERVADLLRRSPAAGHAQIADALGLDESTVRYHRKRLDSPPGDGAGCDVTPAPDDSPDGGGEEVLLGTMTAEDVSRLTSLDDLLQFFKVDVETYEVVQFRVNKWEQASGNRKTGITVTPLYQVRATLRRRSPVTEQVLLQVWEDFVADAVKHAPEYRPPHRTPHIGREDDPHALFLSLRDAHIGLLAWGRESGENYDVDIAVGDYTRTGYQLLAFTGIYPTERIVMTVGDDLLHVDMAALGRRGGATTAGTPQDIDGRLARMFTMARRAVIEVIDRARLLAPVDVICVPGNHDSQTLYRLAVVLEAWYRMDADTRIIYGPRKRFYYGYGNNTFMLTHGEEYLRTRRDSLPLIFATECPPDLWTAGRYREIHTGHFHIRRQGRYVPTLDVDETRGIITRSLPGLTAVDAWHYEQGYAHRRAGTALVYRRSGGLAGLHEIHP